MDLQHGEEEAEHSSQQSSDHRCKRKADAAAAATMPLAEGVHGESTDLRDEADTAGVIKEQVEVVEEEVSAPLVARPCSLLQLLLRAFAGCLLSRLLHGYCSDNDDPKPAANADVAAAAVVESPTQEGEGAGNDDKAAAASKVATQAMAARRPPPPSPGPQEGSGGNGGSHN